MLWWTFTDAAARTIVVDWESEASGLLARFRAAAARHPDDPAFEDLIQRLRTASPEVRAWWPRHELVTFSASPADQQRIAACIAGR